jgi:hypothetical protein
MHQLLKFFHAGRRREEFAAGLERAIAGPAPSPGSDGAAPGSEYLGMKSELAQIVKTKNRREFKRWLEED